MSGVSVQLDDVQAQALLQRVADIIASPARALSLSAMTLRRLVHDTFRDQQDPWGRRWTPHAPATRTLRNRVNAGIDILVDTGTMAGKVEARADANGVEVTVGTDYASYHQFGDPNHTFFGRPSAPLPQRAFLPVRSPGVADIPATWWLEILLPVEAALARAAGA